MLITSVSEVSGLSSQTLFSEDQIKVWFSAQRLKHGVSWTPEEVDEARRKKFNGTVQQTITVIPAPANGLPALFQTCQLVGQPGLVLTQSPITLAVAPAQRPGPRAGEPLPPQPGRRASPPPAAAPPPASGADPLGLKPKKSKQQLADLKASYGRRQVATEAEISRLMRVTGLTKRAIKKWFSDTRYNQRNAKEHHGGGALGEAPPLDAPPGELASAPDGADDNSMTDGSVAAVTIVIDSSDDASDGSAPVAPGNGSPGSAPTVTADGSPGSTPAAPSDPRIKFRHAFPDFTPQKFKEKTCEQRVALEASFLTSRTPSDEELSRLRAHTKLTRREIDAWFTERRKASEPDGEAAAPSSSSSGGPERQATPPAARKVLKKTPEQLHILKTAFVRSQWPSAEEYDAMATQSGLPRSYIVNWFGDTRYAWKNSSLKWFYLYQTGKVDEALNGAPVKSQKKSRKRFRGWSRRTRRPYPCRRSPQPGATPVKKAGEAFLRDHYLSFRCLQEKDLDELVSRSGLGYQQVRDWFSETQRRVQEGLQPFSTGQEGEEEVRGGEEATDEEEEEGKGEEDEMELEARGEGEGEGEEEEQLGEERVEEEQDAVEPIIKEKGAAEPIEEKEAGDSEAVGQSQSPQQQEATT
ncbi:hypothetical protein CRUP_032030 [Coryphaenoides rupestris]|nr:hypothetical protein CRUP_032030 [Coryphaenoides rupestris]